MTNAIKLAESCDPQLLDDERPSRNWGLDKLGEFAQRQQRRIVDGEQALTLVYWLLGQALDFARKQLTQGQWGAYLAELGIDKTRASKARAIFRTFPSLQNVEGKSVEEAYEHRERRHEQTPRAAKRKPKSKGKALKAFLGSVPKEAEAMLCQAATMQPSEVHKLITAIDAAIENLQRLRETLAAKATDAAAGGEKKPSN